MKRYIFSLFFFSILKTVSRYIDFVVVLISIDINWAKYISSVASLSFHFRLFRVVFTNFIHKVQFFHSQTSNLCIKICNTPGQLLIIILHWITWKVDLNKIN